MARIVLNTFGSFGDVHPYLGIAIELQRRGHKCVLATGEIYRQKITSEGVQFAAVSPNVGELLTQPDLVRKLWHPTKGSVYLLRDYLLPKIEQSYADLYGVCENADLLLTHAAGYAGPIVAAVRKLAWLSVALQPAIFFSAYDPAVIAMAPWTRHLYALGRWPAALMLAAAELQTRRWAKPVFALRRRLNIDNESNPVMRGVFSPLGTLTLFSPAFAQQQPDWPPDSKPSGFVFYDRRGEGFGLAAEPATGMSESLRRFLSEGPPPILFTLGSSAVTHPGNFYTESAAAARKLGVRAVMLMGRQVGAPVHSKQIDSTKQIDSKPDGLIHVEDYASYSAVMPLVSAVVCQGGIGTVAHTLRAGKPMLIVPWAHDQPDNGYRLQRMGVGKVLPRSRYTSATAASSLRSLLADQDFAQRAKNVSAAMSSEDGLNAACGRIEDVLSRVGRRGNGGRS